MITDVAEVLDEFRREVIPRVRKSIKEHISTYPDDFKKSARIECLKGRMEDIVFKTLYLIKDYDRHGKTDAVDNRLFVGGQLLEAVKTIVALQREIISLRRPEKPGDITDDMIRRAKEYPFTELHEFHRNMALCPFHADKEPSMRLFPNNHVYCFSCGKGWDTIAFMQEKDNLSFTEAIRRLL